MPRETAGERRARLAAEAKKEVDKYIDEFVQTRNHKLLSLLIDLHVEDVSYTIKKATDGCFVITVSRQIDKFHYPQVYNYLFRIDLTDENTTYQHASTFNDFYDDVKSLVESAVLARQKEERRLAVRAEALNKLSQEEREALGV